MGDFVGRGYRWDRRALKKFCRGRWSAKTRRWNEPMPGTGLIVKPGWPLGPECKSLGGRHRHRKVRRLRPREGRARVDPQDDGRRRKGPYYRDSAAQDPTALQEVKVRSPTAMRQVMVWHGSLRPLTSKPHPPVIWWSRCVIKDLVIVSEFGPMDQPNSVDREASRNMNVDVAITCPEWRASLATGNR